MPPQPITATVSPGRTWAVLITAPTPVVTPQPISAARSSGMSLRISTQRVLVHEHLLGERREVGELADRVAVRAAAAPRSARAAPRPVPQSDSGRREAVLAVAAEDRQAGDHVIAGLHVRTCEPTASTTPADSWPSTSAPDGYLPSMKCRSEWQTPAATVRISTSRGRGLSIWTSSIVSGCPPRAAPRPSWPSSRLLSVDLDQPAARAATALPRTSLTVGGEELLLAAIRGEKHMQNPRIALTVAGALAAVSAIGLGSAAAIRPRT